MRLLVVVLLGCCAAAAGARATPSTSPLALLDTFNLIDFGDRSGQSESEGRVWIGGNLSGGVANTGFNGGLVPSSYATLTVDGSVAAGVNANVQSGGVSIGGNQAGTINLNGSAGSVSQVGGSVANMSLNGGALQYGGTVTGNLNLNGGATRQQVPGLVAGIPLSTFASLQSLPASLNAQAANGSIVVKNGTAVFTGPAAGGQAVFSIADGRAFFSNLTGLTFNLGSNVTGVDINVAGGGAVTIGANFLGGQNTSLASLLLWNFDHASLLTFNTDFGGTVLAPFASVLNNSNIEGTLVAGSLVQNAELHAHYYTGALPPAVNTVAVPPIPISEPAAATAVAAGLLVLVGVRSRRR